MIKGIPPRSVDRPIRYSEEGLKGPLSSNRNRPIENPGDFRPVTAPRRASERAREEEEKEEEKSAGKKKELFPLWIERGEGGQSASSEEARKTRV